MISHVYNLRHISRSFYHLFLSIHSQHLYNYKQLKATDKSVINSYYKIVAESHLFVELWSSFGEVIFHGTIFIDRNRQFPQCIITAMVTELLIHVSSYPV